jgi:phosphatidylinositol kinase/protein kinase (PI-3  family)
MDTPIIKESKTIRRYIRKDGTISEREYIQRYAVVDWTKKITKKTLIAQIKELKKEQYKQAQDFLYSLINSSTENGGETRNDDLQGEGNNEMVSE